VYQIDMKFHR